jgi:hypothetical protein
MENPRPFPEMREGQEAFDQFKRAVKAVLTVPKSAMPPSPFAQVKPKRSKLKVLKSQ